MICTMDDARGDFLRPPHGTTPAAVIANKNKLRSFKYQSHQANGRQTGQVRWCPLVSVGIRSLSGEPVPCPLMSVLPVGVR